TATAGLIDEAGAIGGTGETGGGTFEVFSVPMRATAAGTLAFATNPADESPSHDVLVYSGSTSGLPASKVHYGAASIEVGATFTAVNDTFAATEDTQNTTSNPLATDTTIASNTTTLII